MVRIFLWLSGLLFSVSSALSAPTLVVYGDSLSAGYGLPAGTSWVKLLQDKMISQKIDYKLINASISGETSLGGLNRIQATLTQHHPRILILALGANDGLRGLSVNEMSKNLESIIKACTSHHTQILLVGMQLPPNYGNAYTQKFHLQFIDLAKKYHLPFVPFLLEGFGQNPDWFQADGLHPSVKAQPKILDTLWPTLQPLLAQKK